MSHDSAGAFINPYTFVPFPEIADASAFRRAPAGHGWLPEGRYDGRIDVELTARGPLLVRGIRRGDVKDDVQLFPRRVFPGTAADAEPVPFLPGSSLAGVVRSAHELLAGGCLRVFDEDFRPGYRDPVQAREEDWTLALVEEVKDSRPTRLRLCPTVVWVPARRLADVLGGADKVVTGKRVKVTKSQREKYGRGRGEVWRNEAVEDDWVEPGESWVVLVTDSGARKQYKSFFCAVGELGEQTVEVTETAWEDYQRAVAGADDIRQARGGGKLRTDKAVPKDVRYAYQRGRNGERLVGRRHEARPVLHPGQVLWARESVRTTGPEPETVVDGLALAHIWRHAGQHAARTRVPEVLLPCEDAELLCPTCRVFGSADTGGAVTGEGRQDGYRGHLRFSDASPLGEAAVRTETLAPLGAPRPGAGQFYLRNDKRTRPAPHATPLREWGSRADPAGKPRPLRGRKQYWLTGRHEERPLFRVRERTWDSKMVSTAEAVRAGSRFAFSVHFSGLDQAELGAVLVALDLRLLLGERTGYAVGGGRPFGFGSCTATVTGVETHTATSRYAGHQAPGLSVGDAVSAFREQVDRGIAATWPAATAALTLDQVAPGSVWYPPEQPIPEGELTIDDLKPGFEFWTQSRGYQERHSTYPLIPLPEPTDDDQTLEVRTRAQRGQGGGGSPRRGEGR